MTLGHERARHRSNDMISALHCPVTDDMTAQDGIGQKKGGEEARVGNCLPYICSYDVVIPPSLRVSGIRRNGGKMREWGTD